MLNKITPKTLLFAISSILIAISPAKADWQFTKWGMSPAQLQKASPVKLSSGEYCPVNNITNGKGYYDVKYATDWNVGSIKFIACYLFINNQLRKINLFSKNAKSEDIVKGLSQKYGQPIIKKSIDLDYIWDLPNEKIKLSIRYDLNYTYLLTYESKLDTDENAVRNRL